MFDPFAQRNLTACQIREYSESSINFAVCISSCVTRELKIRILVSFRFFDPSFTIISYLIQIESLLFQSS